MQITKEMQVGSKRKKSKKRENDDALKEWRLAVYKRAGDRCEYCGSTRYRQAHHIYGKRNYSVRTDLDNGVCLCAGHHTFKSDFSAHQTPMLFSEWIISKRGQEWHDRLKEKAMSIKK